jgi:hypothetical protein
MNIHVDLAADFGKVQRAFRGSEYVDIVLVPGRLFLLSRISAVYQVWSSECNISSDVELTTFGVTVPAVFVTIMPINKKTKDSIELNIFNTSVVFKLNGNEVLMSASAFDKSNLKVITSNMDDGIELDVKAMRWFSTVYPMLKDTIVSIHDGFAVANSGSIIYAVKNQVYKECSFGFLARYLKVMFDERQQSTKFKTFLSTQYNGNIGIITALMKADKHIVEDLKHALTYKYRVRISFSLYAHRDILRVFKIKYITFDFSSHYMTVESELGEIYSTKLEGVKVETISKSLDKRIEIKKILADIKFSNSGVVRIISNEQKGVILYLSSIIRLITLHGNRYILCGGEI